MPSLEGIRSDHLGDIVSKISQEGTLMGIRLLSLHSIRIVK